MLKAFSERVVNKAGFDVTIIVTIATMIAEIIANCQDKASDLAAAIDNPNFRQRVTLRMKCRQELGWRDGNKAADAIIDEAKPFRAAVMSGMAAGGEFSFERAVLDEVAGL
jgi:hypothetical protein